MSTLRRFLAPIAALLALVVAVQTTDLVTCADEVAAAEYAGDTHLDAPGAQGAHAVPVPGDSHEEGEHEHDGGAFADCLCHVVFAPTGVVPAVGVRPVGGPGEFAAFVAAPPEVEPLGLEHVPLA
jgi:hypothetical protein